MDRIKDISKIKLGEFEMLIKIHQPETKSGIIMPSDDLKEGSLAYAEVIAVGEKIEDYKPSDIIVKTRTEQVHGFKLGDTEYALIRRHDILIGVEKSNFDVSQEISA
jgi:co-chaperonin GroES (HSP10)